MNRLLVFCFLIIFSYAYGFSPEENFILLNGSEDEECFAFGPYLDERISPCSTFKIALSLMGYDAHILTDAQTPTWDYQEGYDDFLEAWKNPQNPQSWMQYSCIWFSKILTELLGLETINSYLSRLNYGNQDMSAGLTEPGPANPAWVCFSLQISPREQIHFLQNMLAGKLPVSTHAIHMTKEILFKEELPNGWQLFGKTGWSGSVSKELEHSWFVGWVEKEDLIFPFAYLIRDKKIELDQRTPRVKQLLIESGIMDDSVSQTI